MIETPTVFILGAGASIPYGYPSGEKLRDEICYELKDPSHPYTRELLTHGFSEKEILEFRNNFYYSGLTSIDAFLEHRTEFIDIGKLTIARSLIPHENLDDLFETGDGRWYRYFYDRINTSFEEFDKNNFSVITFNYDRSFEQFLFTALKNTYGKSDELCASKLEKIPIVHVYGNLSDLDWQSSKGRPYKSDLYYEDFLKQSADSIKIIHEDIDEIESFKEAHKLIENAKKIIFFGFSYNRINVKRLKIPPTNGKRIVGTTYGLEKSEVNAARKLFNRGTDLTAGSHIDILLYLRRYFHFE